MKYIDWIHEASAREIGAELCILQGGCHDCPVEALCVPGHRGFDEWLVRDYPDRSWEALHDE